MNGFTSVVSVFAIGYAVLAVALFFYQPKLLYFPDMPTRQIQATPEDVGLDFDAVTLTTSDNEQLHAWFVPADPARGTLLFCHGNAGNNSHRLDSIRLFHELGLSVLIFDYRGYGQSTGKPTEKGTYRDADAAWQYLVEQRGIPPQQIILFGRSLGASIAAELATRQTAAGVMLELATEAHAKTRKNKLSERKRFRVLPCISVAGFLSQCHSGQSRPGNYYDATYSYLKSLGINNIES